MTKEYNIKQIRSRVSSRASDLNMEVNQNATDVKVIKLNVSRCCTA